MPLSIFGFSLLVVFTLAYMDHIRVLSAIVYGTSLMLLFLASTLYHSANSGRSKRSFQIFDYSAIYFLIADTYTPTLLLGIKASSATFCLLLSGA